MHRVTLEGVQTSVITMWHSLRVILPQSLELTRWWWHSWTRSWWHSSWSSTNTSWHPGGSETETSKKTMSIANILFMVNLTLACSNYLRTTVQQLDHCGRGVEEERRGKTGFPGPQQTGRGEVLLFLTILNIFIRPWQEIVGMWRRVSCLAGD